MACSVRSESAVIVRSPATPIVATGLPVPVTPAMRALVVVSTS